jgi:hypothetical protein
MSLKIEVKITETDKCEFLLISDLLLGLVPFDKYKESAEVFLMSQNEYDFFADLTEKFLLLDNRYYRLCNQLDSNMAKSLQNEIQNLGGYGCVLENFPYDIEKLCDKYQIAHAVDNFFGKRKTVFASLNPKKHGVSWWGNACPNREIESVELISLIEFAINTNTQKQEQTHEEYISEMIQSLIGDMRTEYPTKEDQNI